MEAHPPSIVLAAYAETLLDGRRVVFFGDATSAVGEELVERGARLVHIYDPEPSRAAIAAGRNQSKQISVAPLDDADLAVRDGAFDVAFVEDLSTFAHPEGLLRRVRKALSSRGTAIVATPNPEARTWLLPRTSAARTSKPLSYYELYDAVTAEFTEVRMLGQTAFVGYAVVDFAPEGEPEVSIDSGLVPGGAEEPEWFVALGSRDHLECDPIGIVQLPAESVIGGASSDALSEELRAVRAHEAALVERVASLEVAAAGAREARDDDTAIHVARADRLADELASRDARVAELEAKSATRESRFAELEAKSATRESRLAELEAKSATRESRFAELEAKSATRESRLAELEARSAKTDARQATDRGELAARDTEIARLTQLLSERTRERDQGIARIERLEAQIKQLEEVIVRRATEFDELRKKLSEVEAEQARTSSANDVANEVSDLEAALKERGEHVRSLSEQLREAERVGRELLRELGHARGSGNGTDLLTAENARLQANLEALTWTVEELEGRLSS